MLARIECGRFVHADGGKIGGQAFLLEKHLMRRLLRVAIILHLSLAAAPVDAAPWVRSFVVTLYEPAFHYAGPADAEAAPGSDCPRGTMPDNDYRRMLKTRW